MIVEEGNVVARTSWTPPPPETAVMSQRVCPVPVDHLEVLVDLQPELEVQEPADDEALWT